MQFRFKVGTEIRLLPLSELLRFDRVIICFTTSGSENVEIKIKSPNGQEDITFLYDLSFSSRLNQSKKGVIFSQYGKDFFEIFPTTGIEFYTLELESIGNLSLILIS